MDDWVWIAIGVAAGLFGGWLGRRPGVSRPLSFLIYGVAVAVVAFAFYNASR